MDNSPTAINVSETGGLPYTQQMITDVQLLQELRQFVAEREWEQFHTPENLAKSISIEAAELLECFQWGSNPDQTEIESELADVLTYCVLLADKIGLEPKEIMRKKLVETRGKYPIEKSRGKSTKYDRL